jgi:hypothetical protein
MKKTGKKLISLAIILFILYVLLQYLFPTKENFMRYTNPDSGQNERDDGPSRPPGGGPPGGAPPGGAPPGGGPPGMPKMSVTRGPPVAAMRGQPPK